MSAIIADVRPTEVAKAAAEDAYWIAAALMVGEATTLLKQGPGGFDLVVAADSFVYIGDLAPIIAAIGAALARDGLTALTVGTGEGDGFALGPAMRFVRPQAYVEATTAPARLHPLPRSACFRSARGRRRYAGPEFRVGAGRLPGERRSATLIVALIGRVSRTAR
jgi:predicted TPR repeat methyltransferase